MIRSFARAAVAVATLFALSCPAFAHVTLEVQEAGIGSAYKGVARIGHGCGAEATNVVSIQIPEGFLNAKPMPKAGWTLETVIAPSGSQADEGVREIIWSGGSLPNEWYDEFVFVGTFADTLEPGRFYFPTIQECASGEEAWIDVTCAQDAEMPAPSVMLVPGEAAGH